MQKKRWVTLLCLLLISCMLFSACQAPDSDHTETTESTSVTTAPEKPREVDLLKNGTAAYTRIVYPEGVSQGIIDEVIKLKDDMETLLGVRFLTFADSNPSGKPTESKGEIIVGDCLRVDAQNVLAQIQYLDYAIVITDSNIVITAYQESVLTTALREFRDILSNEANIQKNGKNLVLKWESNIFLRKDSYSNKLITIGGVDISKYTIVYGEKLAKEYAVSLRRAIGKTFGHVLPISDDKTETEYEILLGKVDRDEYDAFSESKNFPKEMEYTFHIEGKKLLISSGGIFSLQKALDVLSTFLTTGDGKLDTLASKEVQTLSSTVKEKMGSYRIMSYNILNGGKNWGANGTTIPYEEEIRLEIVENLIRKYQPDVIGLQEVFEKWDSILPPAIEDVYDILEIERKDGRPARVQIAYNKSRLTAVDMGCEHIGSASDYSYRIVAWAVFEDLQTHERFIVANTHFTAHESEGKTANEWRENDANIMTALLKNLKEEYDLPIFATGDFNATSNSKPMLTLTTGVGLSYAVSRSIDHILYTKGDAKIPYYEIISRHCAVNASDHLPLIADVTLN